MQAGEPHVLAASWEAWRKLERNEFRVSLRTLGWLGAFIELLRSDA